jgi:hypothetical protein
VANHKGMVKKIKYTGNLKRAFKKFVQQSLAIVTEAMVAVDDFEQVPGTGQILSFCVPMMAA